MIKRVVLIFFNILLVSVLIAQDEINESPGAGHTESADSVNNLMGVTVTATRKNTSLLSVPYSVSVLSNKGIDAFQYRSTPEAIVSTPGVFIQKTNHGGSAISMSWLRLWALFLAFMKAAIPDNALV